MNLEEIKAYLKENADDAEVKDFLNSLSAVDATKVEEFLETDEGKRLLQPRLDKHFTKGLESWKENNLDKLVNEKLTELNPEETPEQKEIRELRERLDKAERDKQRQELLTKVTAKLSEKKLPTDLASLLITGGEETLESNLETFETVVTSIQDATRKQIVKDNGRDGVLGGTLGEQQNKTIVDELISNKTESNDRAQAAAKKYGL